MKDPLLAGYDALLVDLDGTVYRGGSAVPGAAEAVAGAHRLGVAVRYVTNNASRGPDIVADQLSGLGIPAKPAEVTTSAQAGADLLVERLPGGADVLVLGTDALAAEVTARGMTATRTNTPTVAAVIQGLSQDVGWRDLAEACLAIRSGALWVACNLDPTLPTDRGELPGNGALVAALRTATNAEPLVAGKPARPLMDAAIRAAGARHPLVIGDRLDTDIAGANAVGADSLVVLTGVSTPVEALNAPPEARPGYLAADLTGVLGPADDLRIGPSPLWSVHPDDHGRLRLEFTGTGDSADPLAALRALCAAHWSNRTDSPAVVRPVGTAATDAVAQLRLA